MHLIIIKVTIFYFSVVSRPVRRIIKETSIDWSAAKKKELEDEMTDDAVDSETAAAATGTSAELHTVRMKVRRVVPDLGDGRRGGEQ